MQEITFVILLYVAVVIVVVIILTISPTSKPKHCQYNVSYYCDILLNFTLEIISVILDETDIKIISHKSFSCTRNSSNKRRKII